MVERSAGGLLCDMFFWEIQKSNCAPERALSDYIGFGVVSAISGAVNISATV